MAFIDDQYKLVSLVLNIKKIAKCSKHGLYLKAAVYLQILSRVSCSACALSGLPVF